MPFASSAATGIPPMEGRLASMRATTHEGVVFDAVLLAELQFADGIASAGEVCQFHFGIFA
jgi:hypothetical protein